MNEVIRSLPRTFFFSFPDLSRNLETGAIASLVASYGSLPLPFTTLTALEVEFHLRWKTTHTNPQTPGN